ncbi:polysaccharide biosynthesis protein [Mucilaginibacter sp. R11]|uniref:Polysaccharide biosynthesis protein n=1 Tax=Mucilaginibacter agri TaxID=2695265 RepID=A0A966DUS9_9SPHI|nr:polysaccharide biosynthesis protein [Mucilaginibacter agri]
MSFAKKIGSKVGVDGAVAYTILSRIIQAGGGLISIFFVTRYLSSDEQGYYYTFASILAIQVFFELGLSGIITQYTAYEATHLKLTSDLKFEGEVYYKSRLSSLLRFCVKWFGIISIALFMILIFAGFYFFARFGNKTVAVNWQYPWILLCLATSLNLFIDPLLAFFDGLGMVKDMARFRFIQKASYFISFYALFFFGFKLYSAAIASLIAIGINYVQITFSGKIKILYFIWKDLKEWTLNYYKEIFPYQWKIAVSWISGYFIFQLFNPVLFATEGAKVAGEMGVTLSALNGVLSISLSWINTKVPLFSSLIAKKEYEALDTNFNKTVKNATLICLVSLVIFIAFIYISQMLGLKIGYRFLPFIPLLLLCIITLVNQYVSALATYLRCHKKEPFLLSSIVMGILTCTSTLMLGKMFGLNGIVWGYSSLIILVCLPWSLWLFIKNKAAWHY